MEIIACIYFGGSEWAWHFAPKQSPTEAQHCYLWGQLCWPLLLVNTEDYLVYTVTAYISVKAISNIRQLETNSLIFLNQESRWVGYN